MNLYYNIPVPAADGVGAAVDVSGMGAAKTVTLDGALGSATVTIEVSLDGVNFVPWLGLRTPGVKTEEVAAIWLRARVSNASVAVVANCDVAASADGATALALPAPAAAGTGAAVDISALGPLTSIVVTGGFGGTCIIEVSVDNIDWVPAFSFADAGVQTRAIGAHFARVRRANVSSGGSGAPTVYIAAIDYGPGSVDELRIARTAGTKTIYARTGGDDEQGNGTLANPYATIARALQDVPRAWDGTNYVVDCTGVTELVADQMIFPMYQAPGQSALSVTKLGELNQWDAPLTIQADPTVIQDNINLTGQAAAPTSGLRTLTDATQAWVVNEHVGRIVVGAGFFQIGVVASNTATDLEVSSRTAFTSPVRILEPSATIRCTDAANTKAAVLIQPECELVVSGISFEHANTASYAVGLWVTGSKQSTLAGCWLQGLYGESDVLSDGCWFTDDGAGNTKEYYMAGGELRPRYSYLYNQTLRQYGTGGTGNYGPYSCIIDDCTPVGHGGNNEPEGSYEINYCAIRNAKSNGVDYYGGGRCSVRDTTIDDSVAAAVSASGPGLLQLINVTGTGNATWGCRMERGVAVEATGTTAVTGGSGDVSLGGSGVTAWGAAPANDLGAGVPQGCFLY